MTELMLLARTAGQLIALDAATVETVIDLKDVVSVPRAGVGIVGVTAVRSRVVTVVDPAAVLGAKTVTPVGRAIVIQQAEHSFAILVESAREVVAIPKAAEPIAMPVDSIWGAIAKTSVDTPHGLALVINPADLLPSAGLIARAA